jgi:hypothetical protein
MTMNNQEETEQISVYLDSGSSTFLLAVFTDEEAYMACVDGLVKYAEKHRCKLIENFDEKWLSESDNIIVNSNGNVKMVDPKEI